MIDKIDSVGCSDYQYFIIGIETIHLAQKLVNGCCGLMGISKVVESASQGINLVNEDDASVFAAPCTCEQLSYSFRANPDEDLLKLRCHNFDKATSCLISQRSGK